ncbi:(2Fe-2S)-binding protein [bacterium]|nr:(2Fe-2S)-binding protein [bacterium]
MIICVCKRVSDKAIRERASQPACALRDLRRELCVGTQCGKCLPDALQILREQQPKKLRSAVSRVA